MNISDFRRAIAEKIADRSVAGTAEKAGLPRDAIRNVLQGHEPRLGRAAKIASALGLELTVGPPRPNTAVGETAPVLPPAVLCDLEAVVRRLHRLVADAGGDPIPPDLRAEYRIAEPKSGYSDSLDSDPANRPVDIVELAAAAGGGTEAADERVIGRVWFRRDWLDRHGLDSTRCVVIGVRGESMEPTLMPGSSILIARDRLRRRSGRIYVMRTEDGLIVKRIDRDPRAGWQLLSDHPAWPAAPWPAGAEIIGEVVWVARTLGES